MNILKLFELPNSFVKRRLKIEQCKNWVTYLIDQVNSIVGVTMVLTLYTNMNMY